MKILSAVVLLIFPGIVVVAQTTPAPQPAPMVMAVPAIRVVTESGNQVVKGQPFSAEAVSESVQTLADGNRIVRHWSEKLYRSTEGKFRREGTGTPGAALGSYIVGDSGVTILDPVGGFRYSFDPNSRTARMSTFRIATPAVINGEGKSFIISQNGTIVTDKPTAVAAEKAMVELKAATAQGGGQDITPSAVRVAELKAREGELRAVAAAKLATTAVMPALPAIPAAPGHQKWETHTEQLGVQNFEGVDAEGTRTITTIPADAIGNERPIEIVYERWYSKELQMIVYSKHSDPRFGEQTYRLTNINRSEPDPSLFEPPPGFKVVSEARPEAYRILSRPKVERTVPVKAVSTATVTKP